MFFKLSFRNVRKSFSDYTLYFLTLTFGICVFYVFNSIEAQKAMMQISQSTLEIMKTLTWVMNGVSVFVSFVLGFLIVYANNFLIRRRKREFGVYMTLGMEKHKISRILISETFIIGVLSLATGLIAGIFLSQGLSVVTAKLFQMNMTNYTFVFSIDAFWKTIVYFGIIFLIAVITSAVAISKYRLIDLINSTHKNEKQRVKNPVVTVILFLLAIALIGVAYWMVLKYGLATFNKRIIVEITLGAIGTFLLFASLSGALPQMIKANKKLYYKSLNMFILRQISSRINTAHVSMSFICLMLFATIGIFSTGIGMTSVLNKGYEDTTPFDISIVKDQQIDISKTLRDNDVDLSDYANDSCEYQLYDDQLTLGAIFQNLESSFPAKDLNNIKENIYPLPLYCVAVSDYNKLMTLENKANVALADNQVALMTQYAWDDVNYKGYLEQYIAQNPTLQIAQTSYSIYPDLLTEGIVNDNNNILVLIVPDALAANCTVDQSILCFNCKGDSITTQDRFTNELSSNNGTSALVAGVTSKNELQAREGGAKAIVSFVGIYVGFVFLITSAAVLALQQLSETADNKRRYAILRKIGADNSLLSRTICKQTAIYFLIPLCVACIHSIVGIKVANDAIRQVGSLNTTTSIVTAAAVILLVYGAYFLATYWGSKNMILKDKITRD